MYYLVYGFLYCFSLLPLRVLYLFSDLTAFLLYYVVRYRRDVVYGNLKRVFPDKPDQEVDQISRRFYRNFCDNFTETIKMVSASPAFINKHFAVDTTLIEAMYDKGKKCHVLLGHNFNWEMANLWIAQNVRYPFLAIYMPINNRVFDRIMFKLRSKTGSVMLKATEIRTEIIPYRNLKYLMALVADQNAGKKSNAFWIPFFGKPVPFVKGPETSSRRDDVPVIFCRITREKRGYYRAFLTMGEEHPAQLAEGELMKHYVTYLEDAVARDPDMWLWSHRRWKHDWKEEYGPVLS